MYRAMAAAAACAVILVATADAATARGVRRGTPPVAGMDWVTRASALEIDATSAADRQGQRMPLVHAQVVSTADRYPYAFERGEQLDLEVTLAPNGYTAPVTMYLYHQNRATGEKRYYSVINGGFVADDAVLDMFGADGFPVPVNTPLFENLALFGESGAIGLPRTNNDVGRYQWVLELRDASGKRVLSRSAAMYSIVEGFDNLQGDITGQRRLSANRAYVLKGAVFVRDGATLTVDPGTVIFGEQATIGTLIVSQGGRIVAEGTRMQPIVMSSDQPVGQRARSDWGGLIINGRAPINRPGGVGEGEGSTGMFGGSDPADDSGSLRYVRVEFAGREFSPSNELNGIAFQGTGSGTEVEYIQVHFNKDDGVEFFGGTTSAKHVLLTYNADDSLDWTDGWTGNLQHLVVIHRGDDADSGIEADNFSDAHDAQPRSNPRLYNVTLVGDPAFGNESNSGAIFRVGTAVTFRNGIVTGFKSRQLALRDEATFAQVGSATIIDNNILYSASDRYWDRDSAGQINAAGQRTQETLMNELSSNRLVDPMLIDPLQRLQPNVVPAPDSPALDASFVATPPDNGFFDTDVDYLGGVSPGDNWVLSGWATFAQD